MQYTSTTHTRLGNPASFVVVAPKGTTTVNVLELLANGQAKVYRFRYNGTMRRYHYLPVGSPQRALAEATLGRKANVVANELHTSVPTVRRMWNNLALSQEVETATPEQLAAFGIEQPTSAVPAAVVHAERTHLGFTAMVQAAQHAEAVAAQELATEPAKPAPAKRNRKTATATA